MIRAGVVFQLFLGLQTLFALLHCFGVDLEDLVQDVGDRHDFFLIIDHTLKIEDRKLFLALASQHREKHVHVIIEEGHDLVDI